MKFSQLWMLVVALTGFLPTVSLRAAGALPDLPLVLTPDPKPTAPSGWDVFTPPVTESLPSSNAPTIAEWTHSGGPDDTLILTGDKLSNFTAGDEGKDTRFIFYGQTAATDSIEASGLIQRLDGLKAAVTLPTTLPSWSTYLLWPKNSAGAGYPVAVNRTEAWWLNPDDQVTRGDTVSIFGRNLTHNGGTTTAWVYLKLAGVVAAGQWVALSTVNPYRLQFTVPDTLPNGTYEIWAHNGHGARYGWSGPLSLIVTDPYQWNGATFNVRAYGATGDGLADDTDAIMAAHAAALAFRDRSGSPAKSHPTLYFPAGVYLLSRGISLKHDVRYLGDGKTQTILRCNTGFQHTADQGLMHGERTTEHDIEVSNLTLDANGCFTETSFPYDYLFCCTFIQQWKNIRLSNLSIQAPNPGNRVNAVSFGHVSRLVITDCEIIGGNIMLMGGTQVAIDRCSFPFVNDVPTAIYTQAVNGVSVTNCVCADYDLNSDTGQGLGRLIILGGYLGSQRNFYLADNTTVNCGPRSGAKDQNTGEQILSEGNVVRHEDHPSSATPNTVTFTTLAADSNLRAFQTAVIVQGKGLGQARPITSINYGNQTITVSPAWNTTPDSTSVVQIAWTTDRCVIYHNTLSGKSDYNTRLTASCGIEPYGGCHEWIAESNTITSMRYGIYIAGLAQDPGDPVASTSACYFHYFANNLFQRCHRGIFCIAEIPTDRNDNSLVSGLRTGLLGNTFRNNQWSDLGSCGICFDGSTSGAPVDMALFEHNIFTNLPAGINFRAEGRAAQVANAVLYKNIFDRGTAPMADSYGANFLATNFAPVLRHNTWAGFQKTYTGTLPGATLEAPVRNAELPTVVSAEVSAITASIPNSGTAPLYWTASSDSPWLSLSALSGTVPDENSDDLLTLYCDPRRLQPGVYLGTVHIAAGTQTKSVTVSFAVGFALMPPRQAAISISIR